MTKFRIPDLLLQLVLLLIIFAMSNAGYFHGVAFEEKLRLGYVATDEAPVNSLSFVGTLASLGAIALLPFARARPLSRPEIAALSFLGFVLVTALWSNVFTETAYRIAKAVIYFLAIGTIVHRLTEQRLFWALITTFVIIASSSAYLSLTDPLFTFSLGVDGWRGLFAHKNALGAFLASLVIVVYPFALLSRRMPIRLAAWIATLLAIILLVPSQSKTGLALAGVYIFLGLAGHHLATGIGPKDAMRWMSAFAIAAAIIMVPTLIMLMVLGEVTLTSRTSAWAFMLAEFANKPFGLGGYSIPLDEAFTSYISTSRVSTSIDGSYLILLGNLGVIGAVFYILLTTLFFKHYQKPATSYSIFGFLGMCFYLVYGITESGSTFNLSIATFAILCQSAVATRYRRDVPDMGSC